MLCGVTLSQDGVVAARGRGLQRVALEDQADALVVALVLVLERRRLVAVEVVERVEEVVFDEDIAGQRVPGILVERQDERQVLERLLERLISLQYRSAGRAGRRAGPLRGCSFRA